MPSKQGGEERWTEGEGHTSTQGSVPVETECYGVRCQGGGHGRERGRMQKCCADEDNVRESEEDSCRHRRVCTKGPAWNHGRLQGVTSAGPRSKSQLGPQGMTMGHHWWAGKGETSMCWSHSTGRSREGWGDLRPMGCHRSNLRLEYGQQKGTDRET